MNLTRHWAVAAVFMVVSSVLLSRSQAMEQPDERYPPFHAQVPTAWGASAEAAAAQAGHDVLVSVLPGTQALADSVLASRLARIPPGRAFLGPVVGRKAAAAILAWRQNDG
jgi:hypothetical protein